MLLLQYFEVSVVGEDYFPAPSSELDLQGTYLATGR